MATEALNRSAAILPGAFVRLWDLDRATFCRFAIKPESELDERVNALIENWRRDADAALEEARQALLLAGQEENPELYSAVLIQYNRAKEMHLSFLERLHVYHRTSLDALHFCGFLEPQVKDFGSLWREALDVHQSGLQYTGSEIARLGSPKVEPKRSDWSDTVKYAGTFLAGLIAGIAAPCRRR